MLKLVYNNIILYGQQTITNYYKISANSRCVCALLNYQISKQVLFFRIFVQLGIATAQTLRFEHTTVDNKLMNDLRIKQFAQIFPILISN